MKKIIKPFLKKGAVNCILILMLFVGMKTAYADAYYTNSYGIEFSENQYNYFSEMYGENYIDNITPGLFDEFSSIDFENDEIQISKYVELPEYVPYSTYYATGSKSVAISSACASTTCRIVTVATWFRTPNVKSYDVVAGRLMSTSFTSNPSYTTILTSSSGTQTCNDYKYFSNGVGCSCKLPSNGTNISITMSFNVEPRGAVFYSYQHAKSSVTLAKSKKYSLSVSGYGGVILFEDSVKNYYDQMGGVYITL